MFVGKYPAAAFLKQLLGSLQGSSPLMASRVLAAGAERSLIPGQTHTGTVPCLGHSSRHFMASWQGRGIHTPPARAAQL